MITSRVDEFKKLHPELKFSHFDFPENWKGEWEKVKVHFSNSEDSFELRNSEFNDLLEELLIKIYEDMCERIFSITDNH